MNEVKHAKIITRTPSPTDPNTITIDKESYAEKLSSVEQQIEKSIITSRASLAADILGCLREITHGETTELNITVKTHKVTGEPNRIVKTWVTKKEYYGNSL